MLGEDYAGLSKISIDGRHIAYVDHRDPAALSHFWSPVVVVRSLETGAEVGRWTLAGPVRCLEFAVEWVVACEADVETLASGDPDQVSLAAINIVDGAVNRVLTATQVFLPAAA